MRKVGIISKNQRNNKERTWKQYEKGKIKGKNGERESVSHSVMSNSAKPWAVDHQAPLSIELSRQEY